ncbi:MAG: ABC transporter ATP-binding protein [Clostridia bacterium]|nr:ABC transporter ATP-binding protein [Clostridia bacterium]
MMGGPPPGFGGPNSQATDKLKEPKPQSLREVPGYLVRLLKGFFSRLFYIFGLVWEAKPWILFVMIFMAIYNGISPVISAFIAAQLLNALGDSITAAVTGVPISFDRILFLLIFQFGYIFINSLLHNVYNMVIRIAGELVSNHIKLKLFHKAKNVDLASFDRPEFYEKLENANREAGSRPIQILSSTFSIVSTVISMVSFITILASISIFAPILIIILAIPSAIISFIYRRKNFFYMRRRSKDRRQMNYYGELITGKDIVKEVRLFDLSGTFIGRYQETFTRYFGGIRKLILQEGFWHILISAANSFVNCYLFLFIARKVYEGLLQIGDYSLYTGALNSISGGVTNLINTSASIYEGTLFIDNVIAFMNEKQTVVPRLKEPLHVKRHCGHTIELRNVSFRYPGTERMVIKNVNLTLREGETAVLVGLNGAGKTTLIKLITRLYDPTEGEIYLDGHDIRDYDLKELYAMYGIIFQDFGKYAVSIRDNIHFGDIHRELVQSEIENAAGQSDADVFIDKLPDKYDTPLMRYFEENGIELSIGQWQKLSIARAFYSDSDILILDEPTASLDPMAEQEIFNQFDNLRKDKTTIFVSHRLSSATTASKIVVLEYGEVVEEGTHRELMQKHGRYYELFSTQAKRYITEMPEEDAPLPAGLPHGHRPPHGEHPRGPRPPMDA